MPQSGVRSTVSSTKTETQAMRDRLIECFIGRIQQYRRVATRYEKTARAYLGMVHVASIMVLLL
jgi:transposase